MRRTLSLLLLLSLSLTACSKDAAFPIPEGVQTVHAILKPIPFSLTRRGTHALVGMDGKIAAYAESTAVNLRALEGREVTLEGVFEANSDPAALPVLVVQRVLESGGEERRVWTIPALRLALKLPRSWKGSIKGTSATFTASGFTVPVLTIVGSARASSAPLYGPLPLPPASSAAEVFVVGLRRATAAVTSNGQAWVIRVAPGSGESVETVFTFALRTDLPSAGQMTLYKTMLDSVTFTGNTPTSRSASSTVSRVTSSMNRSGAAGSSRAAGEGAPCGGVAGILCPGGLYCKITDPVSDSGVCTRR